MEALAAPGRVVQLYSGAVSSGTARQTSTAKARNINVDEERA